MLRRNKPRRTRKNVKGDRFKRTVENCALEKAELTGMTTMAMLAKRPKTNMTLLVLRIRNILLHLERWSLSVFKSKKKL
jgi:hypothetical protein